MQNLQIDAQRLWDTLMESAKFGATPKGGICRLTLSDFDRQVRDWFKSKCEALGCTVTVDQVGNMFARRPGKNDRLAPIAMGSHLDTQPTGGKFDGVLGTLAALEVVRTLNDAGIDFAVPTEHNIVGDYSSAIEAMDLRGEFLSVPGVEVTTYSKGFGHFGVRCR